MSGPDVVTIQDMTVAVTERRTDTVVVGYTQITSEGSHAHTAAQVGADPAGIAATGDAMHVAASDPHPGYLTPAEGDVRYAALGASGATFPLLEGYGLVAAPGDPVDFVGSIFIPGDVFCVRVWVPAGTALTNLWAAVRSGGNHDGVSSPNQLGAYSNAGVLLGATANNPTLWTATGWRGGPIMGGPIPAATAGRFVYLAMIARGISGGLLASLAGADDNHVAWLSYGPAGGNRRGFYQGGAALPASIDPVAGGVMTTSWPLLAAS